MSASVLYPHVYGMIYPPLQNFFSLIPALKTFADLYRQASQLHQLDGWSLGGRDPKVIKQLIPLMEWFYDYYYRVETDGWEQVPSHEPVMLVGSHNGGLASPDMYMMMLDWWRCFGSEKPLYGLMTSRTWDVLPPLAHLEAQMGAVRAHPRVAIEVLKHKASMAVYPGGLQDAFRPYDQYDKIYFHNRKGFVKLAIKAGIPIVPMISYGAHSTLRVLADIYPQLKYLHDKGMPWPLGLDPEVCPIYLGLPWGLAVGPLPHIPLPMKLHTRIVAPIRFEYTGGEAARNQNYVEVCYEKVCRQMQAALDGLISEHQMER